MNFYELKKNNNKVYGGILLERILRKKHRKTLRAILLWVMSLAVFGVLLSFIADVYSLEKISFFNFFILFKFLFRSIFFLFFSLWIWACLAEIMYLSFYFTPSKVDFEVLKIVSDAYPKDITKSFLESEMGQSAMRRLNITNDQIITFLDTRTDFVSETEYEIIENTDEHVSFSEFGFSLAHFDSDFNKFLKSNGITIKEFKKALDWVSRINEKDRDNERWWTKEKLARIPSIGRSWAFGQIYYLEKFGHSIYDDTSYLYLGDKGRIYASMINKIENILVKDKGSNVLLITKDSDFGMEIVSAFGKEIVNGTVIPTIESKRIYVLDCNSMLSVYDKKADFENMFQRILIQTSKAGNVILVIPHLSDFIENSRSLGSDVRDILNEALGSPNLQIIALSNQNGFHQILETDMDFMNKFEKLVVEDLDQQNALVYAEDEAEIVEKKYGVFFTYQSIKRVLESADRYFADSFISDKIADILREVANYASENKIEIISEEIINEVVESKTGVPLGVLSSAEKEKLSNVSQILKQKVIGQDRAIEAIADAMKRARLGVANPKRPLGSFLFIGPTGVGKTETSKALAEVFFGDDENMIRIDMSEYNDQSAVSKLIGSNNQVGILSSKIREKQYGVLLLDEFEKAHTDVFNLFLQILDEGFFSDGLGEKVNARNLIIIATSNAGSDLIYRAIEKNINIQSIRKEMIGYLIENKLLRPELLNRFDEVVLFDPLDHDKLKVIAGLMIEKLNKRLEDKGIDIKKDDSLLDFLVEKGANKNFGAREINRVIQREIEVKIVNALIVGIIEKGDTISFVRSSGSDIEVVKIG